MTILKCKMCGGDIELTADKTTGACCSCGSVQTAPKADQAAESSQPASINIALWLRHVFLFLEDGAWVHADILCEQVLGVDPQNARAHLGKLMAELKVRKPEDLQDQTVSFEDNYCYQSAVCFAEEPLKTELIGYIEHIKGKNIHATERMSPSEMKRLNATANKLKKIMLGMALLPIIFVAVILLLTLLGGR